MNEEEMLDSLEGHIYYNPLVDGYEVADRFIAGNVVRKAEEVSAWIDREEERIKGFPGYDGIEPFIAFAKDTVEMIKTHQIDEKKRKSEEMKSTKASDAPATVMEQFDRMKEKHPDAILLFRAGDFYETYRQDCRIPAQCPRHLSSQTGQSRYEGRDMRAT